jgi:hypothetical protein
MDGCHEKQLRGVGAQVGGEKRPTAAERVFACVVVSTSSSVALNGMETHFRHSHHFSHGVVGKPLQQGRVVVHAVNDFTQALLR